MKVTFNKIDPVGSLEGLSKIGRFLRGDGGKDSIMADINLKEGGGVVQRRHSVPQGR